MFENEEWDINEDYLKDFEILKNFHNEEAEKSIFQRNTSIQEKSLTSSKNQFEFNCSALENFKSDTNFQNVTVYGKELILDIFNNTDRAQKNTNFHDVKQSSLSKNTVNECKKNVILEIVQGNRAAGINNDILRSKHAAKSLLKITEAIHEVQNNLKRKKNVAFSESINESNAVKKICVSSISQLSNSIKENSNKTHNNQLLSMFDTDTNVDKNKDNVNNSKKQVLLDLLKSPSQQKKRILSRKQTVIRKFPGPAGLLSDNTNKSEIIDLDSLDENKNNKYNNFADVCSQNTKNLFTTGAWQLMMDDLPADFQLYDIAIVQENAFEFSKTYKKVPYLAGIIQQIDYKPNDPHIILKDVSGKINACIHHSICKLYPNALGTNIVMLVKDVGLIVTSKKYVCIIISPKNLVSIYSDDARLVETPLHEELLNSNYNYTLNESQISILEEKEEHQNKNELGSKSKLILKDKLNFDIFSNIKKSNKELMPMATLSHNKANTEKQSNHTNQAHDIHDFEFNKDDSWLDLNINNLNSLVAHQIPSSTPMDIKDENLEYKTLSTIQNFVWQKKMMPNLLKINVSKKLVENSDKTLTDTSLNNSSIENNRNSLPETITMTSRSASAPGVSDILAKVRLSVFRSKYAPPPLETTNESTSLKNISVVFCDINKNSTSRKEGIDSNIKNKGFGCDENDPDDEMLSQLDVDAIAANYNG